MKTTSNLAILLVLIATLFGCTKKAEDASKEQARTAPLHVELLSVLCQARSGGTTAKVTINNIGPKIEFAKAIVSFGGNMEDSYFSPSSVDNGVIAMATFHHSGETGCQLISIQDRDGIKAQIIDKSE